ncbi:uncharacterized protein LOC108465190 [Gossypium arboreum]|uniref:uncharacterized protein LOC108465190 n=1 Tax=Gossypium arboreum TaxID=29729 RepID=UPI000819163B|nr:uncharacterized protein LOC108465190 [Gossypium arboreum]
MHVGHLLLGHPWQFDRRVVHEGYTNSYLFKHLGRNVTLAPLTPKQVYEDQLKMKQYVERSKEKEQNKKNEKKKSGISEKTELKTQVTKEKENEKCLLETNEIERTLPSPIVSLLQEFGDVFLDKVPNGLPPIQGIEHQINFVLGAAIPNKLAYRSNFEETKELQRQVAELMEQGYIGESLSLCAVPVLLQVIGRSRSTSACDVRSFAKRGFVVSARGLQVDQEKVKAINEWPCPTNISQVRSFHGLASFYRKFVPNFSTLAARLTGIIKKNSPFHWTDDQENAFNKIKECLTNALLLSLPDFNKTFEVECDASGIGIGAILTQDGRPVVYFSEKLKGTKLKYLTYNKEMYALIQALETWQHYLWLNEFVIHTDHEALKHLKGKMKLNICLAKWVEYLESFPYVIKYKKDLYQNDADFGAIYKCCWHGSYEKYFQHKRYLFREGKLCIPQGSVREVLINEAHSGGLMGHFGVMKTLATLHEHFYWPKMKRDVIRKCDRYITCKKEKSRVKPHDGKKKADFVKQLHKNVKDNIERRTEQSVRGANKRSKRVVFKPGDWVWLHMPKERFPEQRKSKLLPRGNGPFQVLERINDNIYKLNLPGEYGVTIWDGSSAKELDAEPMELPLGPITRARAKRSMHRMAWNVQPTNAPLHGHQGSKVMVIYLLEDGQSTPPSSIFVFTFC